MKIWILAGLIMIVSITGAVAEENSIEEQLIQLRSLHEEGLITKEVYELKQKELLDIMLKGENETTPNASKNFDPNKDLVLFLEFNSADSKIIDESGHDHQGKVAGAKWIKNGYIGGAYEFEQKKKNQGILIEDSDALDCESITVAAWIKTDDDGAGWTRIVDKGSGDEKGFTLTTGGSLTDVEENGDQWQGKAMFEMASGHWVGTKQKISDGIWHHIVGTYKEGVARIYVDGKMESQRKLKSEAPIEANDIDLVIGNRNLEHEEEPETNAYDGQIDEVRIYNRALTPGEVAALFQVDK